MYEQKAQSLEAATKRLQRRPSSREMSDSVIRKSIGQHMRWQHGRRWGNEPYAVLAEGKRMAAEQCARHLSDGDLGLAHAAARVHRQLLASAERMYARQEARRAAMAGES